MLRPIAAGSLFCLVLAPAGLADHANPWATEANDVKSQFHEANQAKSANTPGEDEMKGVMERRARGKLEVSAGTGAAGKGGQSGRGGGRGGRR